MPRLSSRMIRHNICIDELRSKGAVVYDYHAVVTFVSFNVKGIDISYIYHSNPDNTFNLERFKPLVMDLGSYDVEEKIVDTMVSDLERFQNASGSTNFETFLELDENLSKVGSLFEKLFLNYNVDKAELKNLETEVIALQEHIQNIKSNSKNIYDE